MISIHTPLWETKRVQKFVKERNLTHPVAIDRPVNRYLGETTMRYSVRTLPTYAVIDRQGILRYLGSSLLEVFTCVEQLLKQSR